MVRYDGPDCAQCELTLPAINFADCTESVKDEESEICNVFLSLPDPNNPTEPLQSPGDWSSAASWDGVLGNSGNSIRDLIGIGDLPLPETSTRIISKRRRKTGLKKYTMNFDIDDMTDENYEFVRALGCGKDVVIWFATIGGYLYGGAKGFQATVTVADPQLDRGENVYAKLVLQFQWDAQSAPPRIINPMVEA